MKKVKIIKKLLSAVLATATIGSMSLFSPASAQRLNIGTKSIQACIKSAKATYKQSNNTNTNAKNGDKIIALKQIINDKEMLKKYWNVTKKI